ncbi:MAG: hypothetical protein WCK41_06005 [Actinomycetes bacterium]
MTASGFESPGGEKRIAELVEQSVVGQWKVERWRGAAEALHGQIWPDPLVPTMWLLELDRPALVLGSTQSERDVDTAKLQAMGIELAHRHSGGGAVLLEPGSSLWIDLLVPKGHAVWVEDISQSFQWLGSLWASTLRDLGYVAEVHGPAMVTTSESAKVCFAGLGPGEVSCAGSKAVGFSQRRTRVGARFQTVVYQTWNPEPLSVLSGLTMSALPAVFEVDKSLPSVESAFLRQLRNITTDEW